MKFFHIWRNVTFERVQFKNLTNVPYRGLNASRVKLKLKVNLSQRIHFRFTAKCRDRHKFGQFQQVIPTYFKILNGNGNIKWTNPLNFAKKMTKTLTHTEYVIVRRSVWPYSMSYFRNLFVFNQSGLLVESTVLTGGQ